MEPLRLEGLWLLDLAVYLPAARALVIADLHLGYEEALTEDGVLVPRTHLARLEARLEMILEALAAAGARLELLAINGDLKHHFGPLAPREWEEVREFLRFAAEWVAEVALIKGNHDTNLEYLAAKLPRTRPVEHLKLEEFLLIHGDLVPDEELLEGVGTIIIGHEHPAVGLRSPVTGRVEVFKAFLLGRWGEKKLLVQPSFNLLVKGTDLTQEATISPLLAEVTLETFQVFLVGDEGRIYPFTALKALLPT